VRAAETRKPPRMFRVVLLSLLLGRAAQAMDYVNVGWTAATLAVGAAGLYGADGLYQYGADFYSNWWSGEDPAAVIPGPAVVDPINSVNTNSEAGGGDDARPQDRGVMPAGRRRTGRRPPTIGGSPDSLVRRRHGSADGVQNRDNNQGQDSGDQDSNWFYWKSVEIAAGVAGGGLMLGGLTNVQSLNSDYAAEATAHAPVATTYQTLTNAREQLRDAISAHKVVETHTTAVADFNTHWAAHDTAVAAHQAELTKYTAAYAGKSGWANPDGFADTAGKEWAAFGTEWDTLHKAVGCASAAPDCSGLAEAPTMELDAPDLEADQIYETDWFIPAMIAFGLFVLILIVHVWVRCSRS